MKKIIALVTYETTQFPCGGIAAVLGKLPPAIREVSGTETIVIAPLHISSAGENKIRTSTLVKVGTAACTYGRTDVACTAMRLDGAVPTYFVGVEGPLAGEPPAFAGQRHPYDVDGRTLLRDALIFGSATTALLPLIGADLSDGDAAIDWRLVMQDWEAATTALFVSETRVRAALHLVLHNSYDSFAPLTDRLDESGATRPGLARFGLRAAAPATLTLLNRVLPLVKKPVFTVSAQFAHEFTSDLLQAVVMAPHLQAPLSSTPLLGVDNGPFTKQQVPDAIVEAATAADTAAIRAWKVSNRTKALEALATHRPSSTKPIWGDREKFQRGSGNWIVMAGRDDPRQKGYDVAALAVDMYLQRNQHRDGCAQFVFFPIPGDEDLAGLRFIEDLAQRRPEAVLVLPFRWTEGYMAALQASCFGLMPSMYEPFGMANEFYLGGGCVGIGRATGGNVQQMVPLWASRTSNSAVRARSSRFHAMSSAPTGLLFREPDDLLDPVEDWRGINRGRYDVGTLENGRLHERLQYQVFTSMAGELAWAIEDGLRIWEQEPKLYCRMLAAGIQHITQTFSWLRAAQEYARYVDRDDT